MIGNSIENRYKLTKLVCRSQNHEIYKAIDTVNQEKLAVKFETSNFASTIFKESQVLKDLQGSTGVPYYISHGYYNFLGYLITSLLGKSLQTHFSQMKSRFSLQCVLRIAEELLFRIENIHNKGHIHGNINLSNILSGYSKNWQVLYIIDYTESFEFIDPKTCSHKTSEVNVETKLNLYSSLNAVNKIHLSRRDDLESIVYVLIHLLTGTLPWIGFRNMLPKDLRQFRNNLSIEEICKDCPYEFGVFLRYCRNLKFEQVPDYQMLRDLFKTYAKKELIIRHYDWRINHQKIIKNIKFCKANNGHRHRFVNNLVISNDHKRRTSAYNLEDLKFVCLKKLLSEENDYDDRKIKSEMVYLKY